MLIYLLPFFPARTSVCLIIVWIEADIQQARLAPSVAGRFNNGKCFFYWHFCLTCNYYSIYCSLTLKRDGQCYYGPFLDLCRIIFLSFKSNQRATLHDLPGFQVTKHDYCPGLTFSNFHFRNEASGDQQWLCALWFLHTLFLDEWSPTCCLWVP